MSDLIERLEALANETVKLHAAQIMTIREAITALSPPMPDDPADDEDRKKYPTVEDE